MKKIKIAHLYYDLMNLYGENGNIRYLTRELEQQGIDVSVHFLSLDDKIDFTKYDLFYIGMGSEDNKYLVLDDIIKYKDDIKEAIDSNKFFLITGNALDLFGDLLTTLDGDTKDGLGIFNYNVCEEEFRIVGEQLYETTFNLKNNKILGFQNRCSVMEYEKDNLFNVLDGVGSKPNSKMEGIHYNNFYSTYLLGPILVRNPYFCNHLVKELVTSVGEKYKDKDKGMAFRAYEEYIKNFYGNQ